MSNPFHDIPESPSLAAAAEELNRSARADIVGMEKMAADLIAVKTGSKPKHMHRLRFELDGVQYVACLACLACLACIRGDDARKILLLSLYPAPHAPLDEDTALRIAGIILGPNPMPLPSEMFISPHGSGKKFMRIEP